MHFRAGIVDKSIPIRINFFFTKTVYHDLISCIKTHQQIVYGSVSIFNPSLICKLKVAMRYVDLMVASISAHSTNIASTILHTYHHNLSLCRCHVQPTVYQHNSYCIRDIHVTEAIRSCTPISHAPLIYEIPFTHADILIFSCASYSYGTNHPQLKWSTHVTCM